MLAAGLENREFIGLFKEFVLRGQRVFLREDARFDLQDIAPERSDTREPREKEIRPRQARSTEDAQRSAGTVRGPRAAPIPAGRAGHAARQAVRQGEGGNPFPAILENMIQKMGEKEVGVGRLQSIQQHTSRAKRLLQLFSAAGWTRNDIDNSSWQDLLDLLQAAATRGDISDYHRQALRGTAKKYLLEIGYLQGA